MIPFKKILVPVDFSPHSDEATRIAVDLSRKYDASITLLHVLEPVTYAVPEGYFLFNPEQLTDMRRELEKWLGAKKKEAQDAGAARVDSHQLEGLAASEIVDFAREGGFDLIVMGTHGRTGISHAVMGSIAEKVLRKAPCPVLTVKAVEPER